MLDVDTFNGFVAAKWALEAGAFPMRMHSGRSSTDRCLD